MTTIEFLENCLQSKIEEILQDTNYTCKYTNVYGEYKDEYGELYPVETDDIKGFDVCFDLYKDNYYDDIHIFLTFDGEQTNGECILHFHDTVKIDSRLHPDDVIEVAKLSKMIINSLDKFVLTRHKENEVNEYVKKD